MALTSWIRLNNHTTQGICVLESSSISALIRRLITTHMYSCTQCCPCNPYVLTLGHSECKGSKKETRPVGDCSLIFYSSFTSGFHKIPPNSCALLTIVIIY